MSNVMKIDPSREWASRTGIYVRAWHDIMGWGSYDIADLTEASLDSWLRSRGSIDWPISVVKILLGYPR